MKHKRKIEKKKKKKNNVVRSLFTRLFFLGMEIGEKMIRVQDTL